MGSAFLLVLVGAEANNLWSGAEGTIFNYIPVGLPALLLSASAQI